MLEIFAGCEVLAESDHMVVIDCGPEQGPYQIMRIDKRTGMYDACGRFSKKREIISGMLDIEINKGWQLG